VVSGIGWRGGTPQVLPWLAAGGFNPSEPPAYGRVGGKRWQFVAETGRRWKNPDWMNWLEWLKRSSKLADEHSIKKNRQTRSE